MRLFLLNQGGFSVFKGTSIKIHPVARDTGLKLRFRDGLQRADSGKRHSLALADNFASISMNAMKPVLSQ